jgi:hypothetical protein
VPEVPRDWIKEAHMIARAAPGLGNPLDLTVGEFSRHLELALHGDDAESGENWMRRYVEESVR